MHGRSRCFAIAIVTAAAAAAAAASSQTTLPAAVSTAIADVVAKPMYVHTTWGFMIVDRASGATLLDTMGKQGFVPGSIMKTFSTTAALKEYGPTYRFRTPVYKTGDVTAGVLQGNLVLRASGDFSFGLRDRPDGTLAFNSLPEIDHNYATTGFPGIALVKDGDPLAALNELAAQVRANGIRRVAGDVIVDDRLFKPFDGWPDGLIAPIWVNENVIDITTTPATLGQPAHLAWRPKTAAIRVVSTVTTAAAGAKEPPLAVADIAPGVVRVSGRIAADSRPVVSLSEIREPADFARTAFIEALNRAGVTVAASSTGANPARLLSTASTYAQSSKVAEHVSPPFSEYIKVILKVSYNRGADLMVCLTAVKAGSRSCDDGLAREVQTISALGVSPDSTFVEDGAGSVDTGRTSPADQTAMLRNLFAQSWGHYIHDNMEVMGVDGLAATNQVGTPAAGHIRLKDGTRVNGSPGGQATMTAKTQVGYIDARSGRQLVYAIYANNVPTHPGDVLKTFTEIDHDQSAIAAAIQENF